MKIAIQASDLDHARIDGTRVYLSELLARFGKLDRRDDFLLYHRGKFNPALAPPLFPNYEECSIPFPVAWMQTRFSWQMFRSRPKKLFLPIQAAPYFLPKKTEVIVTVHDLAFTLYPHTYPKKHLWKLNHFLEWAIARADKIISVSESTRRDLLRVFPHLPPERIRVIHHGFSARFSERVSPPVLAEKLRGFGLEPGQYALYVGALQPRKNLVRLIEAFNIVKKKVPELRLVLAGERAWLSQEIFRAAEKSPFKKDILFPGQLTFETLAVFYQGARFFVFPSLYEGFGIPILEAFAAGVPVLTAGNSSLPEVAGGAAFYCEAKDVQDIAMKLEHLASDATLRADLVEKGREQLKQFSWERCAEETLAYIRE